MSTSTITRHARRLLAPALLMYGAVAAPMFVWPGLVARVADHCGGLSALDVRGYWTAADARSLVQACGADGRAAYLHLQLLDLVYPAVGGAALLLVTALLARRYGGLAWALLIPVIAMTVLDYAENVSVWTLLLQWPHVDPTVAATGGPITAVKRVAGFATFTIPIVLGAIEAVRYARTRRDPAAPPNASLRHKAFAITRRFLTLSPSEPRAGA